MSHTTKISTIKFVDIDALTKTTDELQKMGIKCSLVKDQVPRMYYSNQHGACKYVLKLNDCQYDIGFDYDEASKGYVPVFDDWQNKIADILGCKCKTTNNEEKLSSSISKLIQIYSKHAIINEAQNNGYTVEDVMYDENGVMQLVVSGF
jgi:hypothetical protein